MSFLTYDGKEDPLGWLNRCDAFFRAQNIREADKVGLASFHMLGIAQHWFHMLERDAGPDGCIGWPMFKSLCHQRFGPPLCTNHLLDLARLPFQGSVASYQEEFLAKMAHASPLAPDQQVNLFTGGLPEPLRTDVELHYPQDLQRAMSLARAYERQAVPSSSTYKHQRSSSRSYQSAQQPSVQATPTNSSGQQPPRPFKRLTPTKMAERRRQGLCYNCDEQYIKGHKCPRLFYLEVSDFVDPVPEEFDQSYMPRSEEMEPLISLHASTGIKKDGTMKIWLTIGNHELTALLDTGSTSNFVSLEAAQRIGLRCQHSAGASVIVANGDRVACQGLAKDVVFHVHNDFFQINCYTIPLDSYDVVLGVSFLKKLSPILWDLEDLCMSFTYHGKRIMWKGLGSERWDIPSTSRLHSIQESDRPLLADLLESFADLFEEPTGLPPSRACDHRIHLLPNTTPVAVRPYCYPHLQKDELEAQCNAMLQQGIIRVSTSPFSAPVTCKKTGWHLALLCGLQITE